MKAKFAGPDFGWPWGNLAPAARAPAARAPFLCLRMDLSQFVLLYWRWPNTNGVLVIADINLRAAGPSSFASCEYVHMQR